MLQVQVSGRDLPVPVHGPPQRGPPIPARSIRCATAGWPDACAPQMPLARKSSSGSMATHLGCDTPNDEATRGESHVANDGRETWTNPLGW